MKTKMNGMQEMVFSAKLREKIANRKTVEVKTNTLRTSPLQPPQRLSRTSGSYKGLLSEVRAVGFLSPIHFSGKTGNIIDGHRRVMISEDIDVDTILGFSYPNLTTEEEYRLFNLLNTTALKFSQKQELYAYVNGCDVGRSTKKAASKVFSIGERVDGNGNKYILNVLNSNRNIVTMSETMTRFISYLKEDETLQIKETDEQLEVMFYDYCMAGIESPFHIKNLLWRKTVTPKQLHEHIAGMKAMKIKEVFIEE